MKVSNENMASINLSVYYIWKNIKSEYNNKKFKISAQTWNDEFDENPLVQIYVNKIKNRIVFKIKTGYKLESLIPETMKLLGSAKRKMLIKIKIEKMYQD